MRSGTEHAQMSRIPQEECVIRFSGSPVGVSLKGWLSTAIGNGIIAGMMRLLCGILMLAILFAQSAWAWEGHAGGFEHGAHVHADAHADGPQSEQAPQQAGAEQNHHCMHSPVHFVAIPTEAYLPRAITTTARILPGQREHSLFSPAPPEQPPTA